MLRPNAPIRLLLWATLALVFGLALLPLHAWPEAPGSLSDKAQHALVFAGLWGLGHWTYRDPARLSSGLLLYGVAMEGAQALTPWRQAELADLLADGAGILAALLLSRLLARVRQPKSA